MSLNINKEKYIGKSTHYVSNDVISITKNEIAISNFASRIPFFWWQNILFPVLILCGKQHTHFNVTFSLYQHLWEELFLCSQGWYLRSRSHVAMGLKFKYENTLLLVTKDPGSSPTCSDSGLVRDSEICISNKHPKWC